MCFDYSLVHSLSNPLKTLLRPPVFNTHFTTWRGRVITGRVKHLLNLRLPLQVTGDSVTDLKSNVYRVYSKGRVAESQRRTKHQREDGAGDLIDNLNWEVGRNGKTLKKIKIRPPVNLASLPLDSMRCGIQ